MHMSVLNSTPLNLSLLPRPPFSCHPRRFTSPYSAPSLQELLQKISLRGGSSEPNETPPGSAPEFWLRTKTKFGDRTFTVAGPKVWNSLSESVILLTVLVQAQDIFLALRLNRLLSSSSLYVVIPGRSVSFVRWAFIHSLTHLSLIHIWRCRRRG